MEEGKRSKERQLNVEGSNGFSGGVEVVGGGRRWVVSEGCKRQLPSSPGLNLR